MRERLTCERLGDRDCPAVFGNPWLQPNLTLSFAPDGTLVNGVASGFDAALAGIPADQRVGEILRAFQSWVAVANVNVGVVGDGGQPLGTAGTAFHDPRFGDVRVAAVPLAADDVALGFPFDITAGTRAGDVTLNSTLPFVTGSAGGYDLYSVVLHEAGHVFGLPGSTDPSSAMYQVADRVRIGPNAGDVAAVRRLYGARQVDAFEGARGNATVADASRLQPASGSDAIAVTADLTTTTDVDVYSFKADKLNGGAFLATLTTSGYSLLVPRLEILDANGHVLASGGGSRAGSANVALRVTGLTEGGTYYARVRSDDPTFAVGGYHLGLRAESTPGGGGGLDDPETGTDDSAATSTDLKRLPSLAGTRQNFFVSASLGSAADVDYYRVRADQPSGTSAGVLTISVVGTGAGSIDPVVEVFDRNLVPQAVTILTHDAGEFSVQLPNADANRDYYVAVRRGSQAADATGNYSLGLDFGGPLVPLRALASQTLTAAEPAGLGRIEVPAGQVLHLLLMVDPTAAPAAVRLSVFDAAGNTIDTRIAGAGGSSSMNVFLPAGTYQYLVGGGATGSTPMPAVRYTILGMTISDPIGPQSVSASALPTAAVPPARVTTPQPVTPTAPVAPSSPNILLVPPTDLPTPPTLLVRPAAAPPAATFSVGGSTVRTYGADGTLRSTLDPIPGRTGPYRTAEADFNNDGVADVVVGTGPGSASAVVILDGTTQAVLYTLDPFEATFTGGVFVAAGDVTGDGVPDLIVTPDQGGGPRVRVFSGRGFTPLLDFLGIDDANFRGGARAAVGDVNRDGYADLVVAAGFAGGPRVAGYDGASLARGAVVRAFNDFFAFEPTLRNGVYVAAADLNGDGFAEVIAGGGPGGGPRVLALDGRSLLGGGFSPVANFYGGDPATRDGARVAVKNLDADGLADLVVATGTRVVGYAGSSLRASGEPQVILDIDVTDATAAGVFVG